MTPEQTADNTAKCCKEIEKAVKGHGKIKHTEQCKIKRSEIVRRICTKHDKKEKFIRKLMGY